MQAPTDSPHASGFAGVDTVSGRGASCLQSAFDIAASTAAWMLAAHPPIGVVLLEGRDWQHWLAEAHGLLNAGEAERVRRRRLAADRDALALAYALHRLVLGRVLGKRPSDVSLYRDERGCPRVAGDMAYTSLSHSDGFIAIAVTVSGPIGVDIESAGRAVVMPEIALGVCHRDEVVALDVLDDEARAAALLTLWVRKEALLKAAGVGLAVPMETFAAPGDGALVLPGLFDDGVQVRMLDAGDRCVAAVAGPVGTRVECCWLRPRIGRRCSVDSSCFPSNPDVLGTVVSVDAP